MKSLMIHSVAGLALLAGISVATADEVIVVPSQQEVVVAPEQQTVIREYVHKHPVASINLLGLELNVGSTLPDTVELQRIDVPDVQYQYAVVGDHTVLVDPATHRIVEVID